MATTTNFGWTTPDDTGLVKDGASAIRTLGSAIDTSLVDLKGGTTNQVLAKNSNTDLDFKWVSDATGIQATIFDAKGDIIAATAADTADRLAVGANGTVLTADSTASTGLKWATPTASAISFSLLNTGGTSLSGSTTTVSSIGGYNYYMILIDAVSSTNVSAKLQVRFNSDSGSNYNTVGIVNNLTSTYAATNFGPTYTFNQAQFRLADMGANAADVMAGSIFLTGGNSSGLKMVQMLGTGQEAGQRQFITQGWWNNSSTISSVSIITDSGTFDSGTVRVFGGN